MDHGQGHEFYWQEGARHAHEDWWSRQTATSSFSFSSWHCSLPEQCGSCGGCSPGVAQATAPAMAGAPSAALPADPAIAALRMRYAKGEVSRDDFQHTMDDLTGVAAPAASWPGSEPGEGARHRRPGGWDHASPVHAGSPGAAWTGGEQVRPRKKTAIGAD